MHLLSYTSPKRPLIIYLLVLSRLALSLWHHAHSRWRAAEVVALGVGAVALGGLMLWHMNGRQSAAEAASGAAAGDVRVATSSGKNAGVEGKTKAQEDAAGERKAGGDAFEVLDAPRDADTFDPDAAPEDAEDADTFAEDDTPRMPVRVLYGTTTQTSKNFAAKLERDAFAMNIASVHLDVSVTDMAEYDFDNLEQETMVVMITSTTEGGLAPPSAAGFFNWLEVRRRWRSERWCGRVCEGWVEGVWMGFRTRMCM